MTGTAAYCGHLGDGFVRVGTQHDAVRPALHIARDIAERLPLAERRLGLVDEDRVAAQRVDGSLEGEPSAQRSLLEEHDELLGIECVAIVARTRLDGMRQLEQGGDLTRGKIGDGAEIVAGQGLRSKRERASSGAAVGNGLQQRSVSGQLGCLQGWLLCV